MTDPYPPESHIEFGGRNHGIETGRRRHAEIRRPSADGGGSERGGDLFRETLPLAVLEPLEVDEDEDEDEHDEDEDEAEDDEEEDEDEDEPRKKKRA